MLGMYIQGCIQDFYLGGGGGGGKYVIARISVPFRGSGGMLPHTMFGY